MLQTGSFVTLSAEGIRPADSVKADAGNMTVADVLEKARRVVPKGCFGHRCTYFLLCTLRDKVDV